MRPWFYVGVLGVVAIVTFLAMRGGSNGDDPGPQGSSPVTTLGPSPASSNSPDLNATPSPKTPQPLLTHAPEGEIWRFPSELFYSEGDGASSRLHHLDLDSGKDEVVLEVPTAEILLPPVGEHLAYVTVTTPDGQSVSPAENPSGVPVVHIRDLESGAEEEFEGVTAPKWSWDGERLVVRRYGEPVPTFATIDVSEMEVRPLELPPAIEWEVIGWADDRLMLFRRPGEALFLASADGALTPVPTPEGIIREPAPSGGYVFASSRDGDVVFQPVDGGAATVVDLGDWIVGNLVPWAGNDRVFTSAATGFEVDAPSKVLILDTAGDSWEVPNTDGSVRAVPTPEGDGFVLARGKRGQHRLWSCLPTGKCRMSAATLPLGVPLLRVG